MASSTASLKKAGASKHWPKINRPWNFILLGLNIAAVSMAVLYFYFLPCKPGGCSGDYGFVFLLYPWLLVPLALNAIVPIIDAFVVYYLVGSRLGLGGTKSRRLMVVIFLGILAIWAIASIMRVGQ